MRGVDTTASWNVQERMKIAGKEDERGFASSSSRDRMLLLQTSEGIALYIRLWCRRVHQNS
jgi:hypothetical protein